MNIIIKLYNILGGKIIFFQTIMIVLICILSISSIGCYLPSKQESKINSQQNQTHNENTYICTGYPQDDEDLSKVSELIPFIDQLENVTCETCHFAHHRPWSTLSISNHGDDYFSDSEQCEECHGTDLNGGTSQVSCNECHHSTSGMADGHAGLACNTCHDFSGGGGGGGSDCSICHGATGSHALHISSNNKGPSYPITCSVCHDLNNIPLFGSTGSAETLAGTTVCDPCHSPGGDYNGVDDPIIGAKINWIDGVYTGNTLTSGKEKWCVTCHDDSPSIIDTIFAPNIAGNESAEFTYGTGYGYYRTGHGLETTLAYPDSGGINFGAGITCDDCHNFDLKHIDAIERTFDCVDGCDSDEYRTSYRLDEVAGANPMEIPRLTNAERILDSSFALCFNCHDSAPIKDSGNLESNFSSDTYATPNLHYHHLVQHLPFRYRADWLPIDMDPDNRNSRMSCVSCHNVHGSTNLSMMRDGSLTGAIQKLQLLYHNNVMASSPDDITLLESTGYTWRMTSVYEYCRGCHGGNPWVIRDRTPDWSFEEPVLGWTLETDYTDKGVYPANIGDGLPVEFRIKYIDKQNEAPSIIMVWIDLNDDGDYIDSGEIAAMSEVDGGDVDYTDGKLYTSTHTINYPVSVTDGIINYRFYATDGTNTAIGTPTEDNSIRIDLNNMHDVPSEYSTIQAAIDDTDNDGITTVLVDDGTYLENINFGGRAISVRSVNGNTDTILDGNATGTVVTMNSGEGSGTELDGFTIQNGGSVTYGGGIYMSGSSPVIINCNISNNTSTTGAGIYMTGSSPIIDYCVFDNNSSTFDGTIYATGLSVPTVTNCTFTNNSVRWGAGIFIANSGGTATFTNLTMTGNSASVGGGIYMSGSSAVITNCNMSGNNCTSAAGIYMTESSPIIDNCVFDNNTCVFDGSIYATGLSTPTISNCTFTNNSVRWGAGIFIASAGSTATFTNLTMSGNNATNGGGLYIRNSAINITGISIDSHTGTTGGGLYIEDSSVVNIDGLCNIRNNSMVFDGGGINITGTSTLNITGCTIDGNSGRWGGGFRINSSDVNITDSSIINNTATYGGGINSVGTSTVTVTNSLIAGNSAFAGGGITTEDTIWNLMNNTIANNSSTNHGSAIDVNTSNTITITNTIFDGNHTSASINEIQGADSILNMNFSIYSTTLDSVGTNNIGLNMVATPPTFVDAGIGNYYLMYGSSGIDTGTNSGAPVVDIVGTSRGLDGDNSGAITGDGSDYDMGAYEYIYIP